MYHDICNTFLVTAPLDIRGLFGQCPSTECSVKLWQTLPVEPWPLQTAWQTAGWSPEPRVSIPHTQQGHQRDISSCFSPSFCRRLEQSCPDLQLWQLDEKGSVPQSAHFCSYLSWSHSQCGISNLHPTHPQRGSYAMRYPLDVSFPSSAATGLKHWGSWYWSTLYDSSLKYCCLPPAFKQYFLLQGTVIIMFSCASFSLCAQLHM